MRGEILYGWDRNRHIEIGDKLSGRFSNKIYFCLIESTHWNIPPQIVSKGFWF